jgi:glycosyltransferase involved in cell wall biosynthesis
MNSEKTIIIPVADFDWGGGIDFIKFNISMLDSIADEDLSIKIFLTLPIQSPKIRTVIRFIKNSIKRILRRPVCKKIMSPQNFVTEFSQFKHTEFVFYDTELRNSFFRKFVTQFDHYLIFPVMSFLPGIPKKNNIGYIPDLQYIHLPYLFSVKECEEKNAAYKKLLSSCDYIFVNSEDTKNDICRTYPDESVHNSIFVMPFCPFSNEETLLSDETSADISKYSLPQKYFIISNQFWMHKDHPSAFKAFAELPEEFHDIQIVCTGGTKDHRNPDYFKEIQNLLVSLNIQDKVTILGYIPKREQITILKKAIAVIQPTLFEGGRGGGVTYDAISHGIPVILSDIPINKEIRNENILYFKAGDPLDLKDKMTLFLRKTQKPVDINKLINQSKTNFDKAKQALRLFIEKAYPNN